MIDLSEMTGIHVDPEARTLRAQGGVTWRQPIARHMRTASP